MKSSLFTLLILVSLPSFGNAIKLPAGLESSPIGPDQIWHFSDGDEAFDINSVSDKAFIKEHFLSSKDANLNFGFTPSSIWLNFQIKKLPGNNDNTIIEIDYPLLDHIELWIKNSEGQIVNYFLTGDLKKYHERPIDHIAFAFPVEFQGNSSVDIFIKVKSRGAVEIPIKIWNENGFHRKTKNFFAQEAIIFGIILAMFLYNLFLFISVRDRAPYRSSKSHREYAT